MAARDYEISPASEQLSLDKIINGLAGDLEALRAGQISINDAMARAALAKQVFNGVRLYLNASRMLSDAAKPIEPVALQPKDTPDV